MNVRMVFLSLCFLLVGAPAGLGETIPAPKGVGDMIPTPEGIRRIERRHVMIPMPKLPFKIDRRLLPHDQPTRAYGKPYHGPMIDVHVHLNTRAHKDTSLKSLKEVVEGMP